MQSDITPTGVRALTYVFNKNMRSGMQGLHVDMKGLRVVKEHIRDGYKVIFMPLYKSFVDFFTFVYVN